MGVTKEPDDRKDKTIQIRVTAEQYDLIKRVADAAHLELSAFVRQLVLFTAHQREKETGPARVQVFERGTRPPSGNKVELLPSQMKTKKSK